MSIVLTGDRPTGRLHLGHYAGSLTNRLALQHLHQQYVMIADAQALTDNADDVARVKTHIYELTADYLAVGLDESIVFIQSQIPELTELSSYYFNLVTLARLLRNPTVKNEIKQKNYGHEVPIGFLCYPISQAADITAFKAEIVPAGADQIPMIEQTNEIVRKFNRTYRTNCLKEVQIFLSNTPRLMGIDGKAKMSKSLDNCIYLADEPAVIKQKVMSMFTDPLHLKISDKGNIEGNIVFNYLDAFHADHDLIAELKDHYQKGGLGDVTIKNVLNECLQQLLGPIRERRMRLSHQIIQDKLVADTEKARAVVTKTLGEARTAMGL